MAILTTPGVAGIVGFGNETVPIPEGEIETVRAVLRSGLAAEPYPFVREGQPVRISSGSLEGQEGIPAEKKNEWRLIVSITMLQRSVFRRDLP